MKDKIFIIWSGTIEIPSKIKNELINRDYKVFIGGNSDNNSQFSSVGDTVIQQMKTCNQAIVIFQNKDDGSVSNNLFFELGYVFSMYGATKVHCVKKYDEKVIMPSDFDSSFVEPIKYDGSDDSFVKGILEYFYARQKMSVTENKMNLINNRYRIHDYIQSHYSESGSKCSDYELAQYILFYVQAGDMFGDSKKICAELKEFKDRHHLKFSDELSLAVDFGLSFFNMTSSIKSDNKMNFYLDRNNYRIFRDDCKQHLAILDEINDTGTFDEWARLFIIEQFQYAILLYLDYPEIKEDSLTKSLVRTREISMDIISTLDKMCKDQAIIDSNDHKGLLSLFYAYTYRVMFLVAQKEGKKDEAFDWLVKTKKERTALKRNFEAGSIDSKISETFSMEYYLTLIEYLKFGKYIDIDEDELDDYMDEIADFVKKSKSETGFSRYIERIDSIYNEMNN